MGMLPCFQSCVDEQLMPKYYSPAIDRSISLLLICSSMALSTVESGFEFLLLVKTVMPAVMHVARIPFP